MDETVDGGHGGHLVFEDLVPLREVQKGSYKRGQSLHIATSIFRIRRRTSARPSASEQ